MEEEPLIEEEKSECLENLYVEGPTEDDIFRAIGHWGRWQARIYTVFLFNGMFSWMQTMIVLFFIPEADHWCKPPSAFNQTEEIWKKYGLPPSKENLLKPSECYMYDMNFTESYSLPKDNISTVRCKNGWTYDTTKFAVSVENEWDLVCEDEFWAKNVQSIFIGGLLVGILVSGQFSDLYGRRKTVLIFNTICIIAGFLTALAPSFWFFVAVRFFVAIGVISSGTAGFVVTMEILDARKRTVLGSLGGLSGSVGYIMLTGAAYYVSNWRYLQVIITIPLLLIMPFLWYVPESIRWLYSRGRHRDAYNVLKKAARENKREFPSYEELHFVEDAKTSKPVKNTTMIDLFRFPNLRKKTVIIYCIWFFISFAYFGITLGINSIGGNLFFNSFISAAVEIPSQIMVAFILLIVGRRWTLCLSMLLGGTACLATMMFNKDVYYFDWPIVSLAMIGKFGFNSGFAVIYIFSAELFPTVARNAGIGTSSTIARIGAILSPYVDLMRHVYPKLPLVCYGFFALLAGLLGLLLPETKDQPVPETIEEAELIGRRRHHSPEAKR